MDTISLKRYIYENKKIEYILEKIGCHNIAYHSMKEFYSCANYNGDNAGAINVKNNEYLNVVNWTRAKDFDDSSDLITLVQYNKQCSFFEAIKYLHEILGLKLTDFRKTEVKKDKINPLDIFTKHKSFKRSVVNSEDINTIEENMLDSYIPILYIGWLREGICPWTAKKFGLAYSYRYSRVVVPMRYWLTGDLLGVNMRTTVDNYKELGIKKYFLTPTYQKSLNLYGLYENYESIKKAGYVVVYESEKSVLKRDSLNDSTGVALSGHTISEEQVRILIGLNVDIVISMDKDVPLEEVRNICEKFHNIRNVYYTYDKWDILDKNDSIADKRNKIFNFFMKYKIRYDDNEHKKYLDSLKK